MTFQSFPRELHLRVFETLSTAVLKRVSLVNRTLLSLVGEVYQRLLEKVFPGLGNNVEGMIGNHAQGLGSSLGLAGEAPARTLFHRLRSSVGRVPIDVSMWAISITVRQDEGIVAIAANSSHGGRHKEGCRRNFHRCWAVGMLLDGHGMRPGLIERL